MFKLLNRLFGSRHEDDYAFPNLLEDKDFVLYHWTLPVSL